MQRDNDPRSGRNHRTSAYTAPGGPGVPEPPGASGGGPVLSRRSMMKAVGLGAAAIAGPGLVAGCSSSSGGSTTKIVFEETKPEVIPYFNNLVAKFNASQQHVAVTHDFTTNLIAAFVRGNPPAIDCDNYNLTTSIFVARGVLANLANLPQAKLIDPNIQALVTQYASFHGETSVLPFSVAACGVVYNMDLFDKVGVSSVPTTWSEFLAVCEKFKSAGITPIYQTYGDTWTTQQGLFDYTVGGTIDVAAFYQGLAREGTNLGPNSSVSFAKDFTAPCKQMLTLTPYFNTNPIAKHYADGNTQFAGSQAGMYMQGPWAVGQVLAINPKLKMGTFPLPATDDASQTKCRVNLDLAIWLPRSQAAAQRTAAVQFLDYLMQPSIMNAYNQANLAFSPLKNAPPQKSPLVSGLNQYVSSGRFYQGAGTYVPLTIPVGNFIQEMMLTGNVSGFTSSMDSAFKRLAIRTSA
jgi:raffinose/stachyose/melibiose transport system substrate-binding protein